MRIETIASVLILGSMLSVTSRAQTTPALELQAAIKAEQVDGDLRSAIPAYQRVAADRSAPRDVRAKALLHLAACYEKLGQQARNVYQQIVREFADQPAAAQARARLAALKQDDHPAAPATMTQRRIDEAGRHFGEGDTDGHRVVYLDRETGELIFGDLAGNTKRVIFKAKLDNLPGWSPSRDFSLVYLSFRAKPGEPQVLAVVKIDGTGYREIARLDHKSPCWPTWSWDNRYLLCPQEQGDVTRLLRISTLDGQTRELLHVQSNRVQAATFSPDGRFIAYQVLASSAVDPYSRIFVLPADGGEPKEVYEERPSTGYNRYFQALQLLDWTADGRYLAIGSERGGKGALHLLPVKDGKPAGAPVFVRYGDFASGQTTASGGLVYQSVKPGGAWVVQLAPLDENGRPGDWKHLDLHLGSMLNPGAEWSGDGTRIVYISANEDAGQSGSQVIHLRNLSTGDDREIYHALGRPRCSWAFQGSKIFCSDSTEKTDLLSISVDSGEINRLATLPGSPFFLVYPSRDGGALYLLKGSIEQNMEVVRFEIATGKQTTVEAFPAGYFPWVTRDERWLMRYGDHGVDIRPASGGDWRTPVTARSGGQVGFSADGNWFLYHDLDSTGEHSLFRIAASGGTPERLGDFPSSSPSGSIEVSPDGHQVLVASGEYATGYELWSLENFVPPASK